MLKIHENFLIPQPIIRTHISKFNPIPVATKTREKLHLQTNMIVKKYAIVIVHAYKW